jgi:hypothetical protein
MTRKKKIDAFLKELAIKDRMNEHNEEGDFDLSFHSSYSVIQVVKVTKTTHEEIHKKRKISKNKFEELFVKVPKKNTHTFLQYDLSNENIKLLLNYSDVEHQFQTVFDDSFSYQLGEYKKSISTERQFDIDSSKKNYSLVLIRKFENATVSGNFDENFHKSVGLGFQSENFHIKIHHLKLPDESIIYGYVPTYKNKLFDVSIDNCIENTSLLIMCSGRQSELIKISKK